MQIFEFQDTEEQTLLCLNYDFSTDCESDRQVALRRLGRGTNVKRYWNYGIWYAGLRVLVAYHGTSPVGHIEYLPIERAPRPVKGEDLIFIDCMFVAPQARHRRVGTGLLQACEDRARPQSRGLVVIAYPDSQFMPAGFFIEHGFVAAAEDADTGAWLMMKAWQEVRLPEFVPRRYVPAPVQPGKAIADVFWCGQCPFWVQARDRLMHAAKELGDRVVVREINTDQRSAIEQWGISNAFYINGRNTFDYPPTEAEIRRELVAALRTS